MTKTKIISLVSFSLLLLLVAMPAGADMQILKCGSGTVKSGVPNDCDLTDFQNTIVNVSKLILGISGSLALLMFIYGGFTWLVSSGNKEMVNKGRKILIAAAIGIGIVFIAFTAVEFTIRSLTESGDAVLFEGEEGQQNWNEPKK